MAVPFYRYSLETATSENDAELYRASIEENRRCKEFVQDSKTGFYANASLQALLYTFQAALQHDNAGILEKLFFLCTCIFLFFAACPQSENAGNHASAAKTLQTCSLWFYRDQIR